MILTEGQDLVKAEEGLKLTAYLCPAGVWTIGYGHTGDVKKGQKITKAKADALLAADLEKTRVSALLGCTANPYQEAAMVSLAFNIGAAAFRKSTVFAAHKRGDFNSAARAFSLWTKARVNGQMVSLPGLIRRRSREAALYLKESPSRPQALMPQDVAQINSPSTSPSVIGPAIAAGAGTLATAADGLNQITNVAYTVSPLMDLVRYAPMALGVVALLAAGWAVWHYFKRRREGRA